MQGAQQLLLATSTIAAVEGAVLLAGTAGPGCLW
jgi:hypothetical protein